MAAFARRRALAIVAALAFGPVFAQSVLDSALRDLTRYFGAAATLLASAVTHIDSADSARVPYDERPAVVDELNRISLEISALRAIQEPLALDLEDYVDKVRAGEFDAERRAQAWRSVLRGIDRVSPIVRTTLEVVEASRWLKVTLAAEDRLALRQVLLGRADLFARLRALPAPADPVEIDALARSVDHYRRLRQSLSDLNVALTRATDRLRIG